MQKIEQLSVIHDTIDRCVNFGMQQVEKEEEEIELFKKD